MSYFEQDTITTPVSKYIKWSGATGKFSYWDKENQKEVELPKSIKFIKIAERTTIKGYSEAEESGIFANEVKYTSKEPLTAKTFKNNKILAEGLYKDIKDKIKTQGAKYCKSVYAYNVDTDELVNFQLYGSGFMPYDSNLGEQGQVIEVTTNPEKQKKGSNTYFIPKFTQLEVDKEALKKARPHFEALQQYFEARQNGVEEEKKVDDAIDEVMEEVGTQVPF